MVARFTAASNAFMKTLHVLELTDGSAAQLVISSIGLGPMLLWGIRPTWLFHASLHSLQESRCLEVMQHETNNPLCSQTRISFRQANQQTNVSNMPELGMS